MIIEIFFGFFSQVLFLFCLIPQVLKIIKTKKVEGLSIHTAWIYFIAAIFSIIYFYVLQTTPLFAFVQVIVSSLIAGLQLILIYRYKK